MATSDLDLAWTLLGQQKFVEATRLAEKVLSQQPENVSAIACRAMARWRGGGDVTLAIAELEKAIGLAPRLASLRHNLATLLASSGDMAGSVREFEIALSIKPDDVMAFYGLSQNMKFIEHSDLLRRMEALHKTEGLSAEAREFLDFGLAKAFDDLGDATKAMAFAVEANALSQRPFDLVREERAVAALAELVDGDAFRASKPPAGAGEGRVFIVGMNRSGTTLVESILSRHPDVRAMGELIEFSTLEAFAFQAMGDRTIDRHSLALRLNNAFLKEQAERSMLGARQRTRPGGQVFTDKMPDNALRLGLISRVLPAAKVIYVRRHPLDVGISNFFQRYSEGQGFSYRMDWIGRRTRHISDGMALWKRGLDLPILDVSYEKLVAEPEAQSRRIVAFTGLPWSPDCLEPQRTSRAVLTASQWQVRQPITQRSVGRWERYEPWIEPMIAAMGGRDWVAREVAEALA